MTDTDLFRLLAALVLLLVAAHLVGRVFGRFRQPVVIGEILGGLLLGPTVLGQVAPAASEWLFPRSGPVSSGLALVYQLGLLLLMFLTGTQMRSVMVWGNAKVVTAVAAVGMVIPFALGLGFAVAVDPALMIGPANGRLSLVLVIAVAISIASIPVISRIMLDLGILRTSFARIVLAVAVLEDVVLNVVIAMSLGLVHKEKTGGFGLISLLGITSPAATLVYHALVPVVFLGVAGLLARRLPSRSTGPGGRSAVPARSIVLVLAVSALCVFLGVVPLFGAFVVGLVAGRGAADGETGRVEVVQGFSMAFFTPVYFAAIGLRLDLLHDLDVLFTSAFILFACLAKAGSVYLGGRLSGTPPLPSLNLAVALNARGGPGIVLAGVAHDAGIVNGRFFTTLVLTAVITSLVAGSWLEVAVARKFSPFDGTDAPVEQSPHAERGITT
ncbi:cation:proton antiporter [Actinosynnema sp. NPDC020468]|uniref:cation:proton antiporter n=1 Tax=Actinosynnema sp. NPDC020468 TaxID=3154488 RepID=UPI0033DB15C6